MWLQHPIRPRWCFWCMRGLFPTPDLVTWARDTVHLETRCRTLSHKLIGFGWNSAWRVVVVCASMPLESLGLSNPGDILSVRSYYQQMLKVIVTTDPSKLQSFRQTNRLYVFKLSILFSFPSIISFNHFLSIIFFQSFQSFSFNHFFFNQFQKSFI